jgi:hypothetical protein
MNTTLPMPTMIKKTTQHNLAVISYLFHIEEIILDNNVSSCMMNTNSYRNIIILYLMLITYKEMGDIIEMPIKPRNKCSLLILESCQTSYIRVFPCDT